MAVSVIKIRRITFVLFVAGCIAGQGCKKKEEAPVPVKDTEQATATDNNIAEFAAADIEGIGGEVTESADLSNFRESGAQKLLAASCATLIVDMAERRAVVDFGAGCVGQDGRVRSGKLLFNFSGSAPNASYYRNPGFKVSVTAQNYVVDNHGVEIVNKSIENTTPLTLPTGTNPGTNLTWSISATLNIVKPNNGGTISWTCARTKELVNTSDPNCYRGQSQHIIWSKAVVKLNGTASGINANKETYVSEAANLVRDFTCSPYPQFPQRHPFISGTLAYSPGNRPTRVVDFGGGECDIAATVRIGNAVYNITLP